MTAERPAEGTEDVLEQELANSGDPEEIVRRLFWRMDGIGPDALSDPEAQAAIVSLIQRQRAEAVAEQESTIDRLDAIVAELVEALGPSGDDIYADIVEEVGER